MILADELFTINNKIFREKTGKSFTEMYEKYNPKLIFFLSKFFNGDTQQAEDLSSETFMTALSKIGLYNPDKAQFSTWLFTIGKRIAMQEKKAKERNISMDIEFDEEGTTIKDFLKAEEVSLRHDISELKATIIHRHIDELREPYKTVIIMREIKKMPYKDISEALDRNLSTVKSQIRASRRILIEKSEREFADIDELYEVF